MSTNKRIPKRSIIGSRVSVCCKDGVWRLGLVTAMRSKEDGLIPMEKKFSVKIECNKRVEEFSENEVIGPGFLSAIPFGTELVTGQHVFVTHMNWHSNIYILPASQDNIKKCVCV